MQICQSLIGGRLVASFLDAYSEVKSVHITL